MYLEFDKNALFIIESLLQFHLKCDQLLVRLHTGPQKDRFTKLVEVETSTLFQFGQNVCHCCDKCTRMTMEHVSH